MPSTKSERLPMIPIRDVVVFPHMMIPFVIGRPTSVQALEFALEVASKGTMLEETLFRINRVEPVAECPDCGFLYTPEGIFSHCPECQRMGVRLIRGTELQIKSLLVEQNE